MWRIAESTVAVGTSALSGDSTPDPRCPSFGLPGELALWAGSIATTLPAEPWVPRAPNLAPDSVAVGDLRSWPSPGHLPGLDTGERP